MLLYSLLHLTGYDLPLAELERFRQWGSRTPGHPEYGLTPGVEATTGPLGQGVANAVGMAIAERRLAAEFDRPGHAIVDHRTFVICSDGDLQEGIASEAASLAGHLRLGKLTMLYDDNHIQLDGPTAMAFSEDVPARFEAYGWHTEPGRRRQRHRGDLGGDRATRSRIHRPSLIAVRTHIGYGSPNKHDSQKAHGVAARAGRGPADEGGLRLGSRPDVLRPGRGRRAVLAGDPPRRAAGVATGSARLAAYRAAFPAEAAELMRRLDGDLRPGATDGLATYAVGEDFATRQASQAAIQALAETGARSCSAARPTCPSRT